MTPDSLDNSQGSAEALRPKALPRRMVRSMPASILARICDEDLSTRFAFFMEDSGMSQGVLLGACADAFLRCLRRGGETTMTGELQAALAGVVVGAVGGWVIGYLSVTLNDRRRAGTDRSRLASALYAEMIYLKERYNRVFGNRIQEWQPDQSLPITGAPLVQTQGFFTVYDGNTDKLGLFKPDEVSELVRAYALAKAHLETLNQSAQMMRTFARQLVTTSRSSLLNEIGTTLKQESSELLQQADKAIEMLRNYASIKGMTVGRVPNRRQ